MQQKFSALCTELKFLYVAITRPKNRLFIYDDNVQDRKPLENIWTRIGAVERVTRDEVKEQLASLEQSQQQRQLEEQDD